MKRELSSLKEAGLAPEWYTEASLRTVENGYLIGDETPLDMYRRVSQAAARRLNRPDLEVKFFNIIWKGWLGLATPVAANMGASRGLPISCYGTHVGDTIPSIFNALTEVACMSAKGGGTAADLSAIRPKGAPISDGGSSRGVVPWSKIFNETIYRISQGNTRRAANALYYPIDKPDYADFLKIRKPNIDSEFHCPYIHQGAIVSDEFMEQVLAKNPAARTTWIDTINSRWQTGEPYLFFKDAVNRDNPPWYKNRGLTVNSSNLCTEITLYTDEDHSFVCCLSSMNLAKYKEWKDTDAVYLATWFLDAVMSEFIEKAKEYQGFERAVRFAEKSRALGLGVLGYHTLLQEEGVPFGDTRAEALDQEIFTHLKLEAERASRDLATAYGEPEWCKGYGVRNTHTVSIAPTVSNSTILGGVSAGIEPITGGIYIKDSAKGSMITYNETLKRYLKMLGKDNAEVWDEIVKAGGSVASLKFLSPQEKAIFATAREIDQMRLVEVAAQRQKYLTHQQASSVNLFFKADAEAGYVNQVHLLAYRLGLKTLYYNRSEAVSKGDDAARKVYIDVTTPISALPSPREESSRCIPCEG